MVNKQGPEQETKYIDLANLQPSELQQLLERGATRDELLTELNRRFLDNVIPLNDDPRKPFLVWSEFKDKKLPELARAIIEIAKMSFSPEITSQEIDSVVTLPSSMDWVEQHITPADFPLATIYQVSREPFDGAVKIMVSSYTKKADGTKREANEPREKVPMYVDPRVLTAKNLLVFDDVLANGRSMEEFVLECRAIGSIKNVYGLVGFSKNIQGGLQRLQRKADSVYTDVIACIQVDSVEKGTIQTVDWWNKESEEASE